MHIRDLIRNVLLQQFSQYGKDADGNYVISPDSAETIAEHMTDVLHKSVVRPVVTMSHTDIMVLAERAGFVVTNYMDGVVRTQSLTMPDSKVDVFPQVERIVDYTVRHVLEKVAQGTVPMEKVS